mmetsp:Transcript_49489/g.129112  ORF Transcript_49489/g.129112 Transcript_49489/m.129112 type:complete len:220 (-) Transcript_49489:377-1036(-)
MSHLLRLEAETKQAASPFLAVAEVFEDMLQLIHVPHLPAEPLVSLNAPARLGTPVGERTAEPPLAATRQQLRAATPARIRVPVPQSVDAQPPMPAWECARLQHVEHRHEPDVPRMPLPHAAHAAAQPCTVAARPEPRGLDCAAGSPPTMRHPALEGRKEHLTAHLLLERLEAQTKCDSARMHLRETCASEGARLTACTEAPPLHATADHQHATARRGDS